MVVTEVFELLKLKSCQMTPAETLCSLVLDEMSITPGCQWDVKSDAFIGKVTLGGNKEGSGSKATKCLAIMLAGISVRWKQVVYYHFTGNSVNGQEFGPIILDIMTRSYEIGLKVISITSDMGSPNQSAWN